MLGRDLRLPVTKLNRASVGAWIQQIQESILHLLSMNSAQTQMMFPHLNRGNLLPIDTNRKDSLAGLGKTNHQIRLSLVGVKAI